MGLLRAAPSVQAGGEFRACSRQELGVPRRRLRSIQGGSCPQRTLGGPRGGHALIPTPGPPRGIHSGQVRMVRSEWVHFTESANYRHCDCNPTLYSTPSRAPWQKGALAARASPLRCAPAAHPSSMELLLHLPHQRPLVEVLAVLVCWLSHNEVA